jgi:ring-1,2-phenylacetyl-CoA epoxidase subunit PaaD
MTETMADLKGEVCNVLHRVTDPEMPFISIIELGMLKAVDIAGSHVVVTLLPTFSGCPALDMIKDDVKKKAKATLEEWNSEWDIDVTFCFHPPWTTDRISDTGKRKLKDNGIAPPPAKHRQGDPWKVACPYCDSIYTTMDNIFGPTACRSILYCNTCKNPFEAMKPVANLNEKVEK